MYTMIALAILGLGLIAIGGERPMLAAAGTVCLITLAVLLFDMGGMREYILPVTEPVIRGLLAG